MTDKGGRAATDHTKDHASTHGDDAGQRAGQQRPSSSCHNDLHCHSTRQRMKRCLHKQLSKPMTLAFVDALELQRRSHSAALAAMQGVPRFSRTGHAMDGSRDKGSLVRPRNLPTIPRTVSFQRDVQRTDRRSHTQHSSNEWHGGRGNLLVVWVTARAPVHDHSHDQRGLYAHRPLTTFLLKAL